MIQFQCDGCRTFLRAAADKAGKRVVCPHCGAKTDVPDVAFPAEEAEPSSELLDASGGAGEGSEDWFSEMGEAGDLSGLKEPETEPVAEEAAMETSAEEPPEAPLSQPPVERKADEPDEPLVKLWQRRFPDFDDPVRRKVLWPAVGVLGVSVVSLCIALAYTPLVIWQVQQVLIGAPDADASAASTGMVWTIASSVYYIIALSRGIHLLLMTDHQHALLAAAMVMAPCGPCCVLGLPIGVYALTVLREEDVQKAFDQR